MNCCSKLATKFVIFRTFVALFFCFYHAAFGQSPDNAATVQIDPITFSIERPLTIIVRIPDTENRPTINFPDIPGFVKKVVSVNTATAEVDGKTLTYQIITQSYQARSPGRFRVSPFALLINGVTVRSEGATLTVRSVAAPPGSAVTGAVPLPVNEPADAAFLQMRTSKQTIFAGEGVAFTLSFYVADTYPYELSFTGLDKQVQAITKRIRPANAWEENTNIAELKPVSIQIRGKKYREYRLFEAIYFPLSARSLRIPALSLTLLRPRPKIGPPDDHSETVSFSSRPVLVTVRPLPPHPMRGKVAVGSFQLEEDLERQHIRSGQSVRYSFVITGEGNVATIPVPVLTSGRDIDVFPPHEKQIIHHADKKIRGTKTFTYFIVPQQNGLLSLANRFQWVYFDPQTERYDTLRSGAQLRVGSSPLENSQSPVANAPGSSTGIADGLAVASGSGSLYAGIDTIDSSSQSVSLSVLVRAFANVVIVLMLLGMVILFFRK